MNELKPCPFCGGKAKIISSIQDGRVYMWVQCTFCNASSSIISYKKEEFPIRLSPGRSTFTESLYDGWNSRINDEGADNE